MTSRKIIHVAFKMQGKNNSLSQRILENNLNKLKGMFSQTKENLNLKLKFVL